jgi:5-methyltetrahydropteroyltriglutamate--homocysteine methyltransferase
VIARSDVVGSLLRPSALVSARRACEAGESGPAALKKAEDEAIDRALLDPQIREGYRQRGSDPEEVIDRCIEMDHAIISGPSEVTIAIHLCRGNNQSKFYAEGDYEPISRICQKTLFQRFLLEFDDERSGGFEPLRQVPEDRTVVLGLVTTKRRPLESASELRARIDEATKFLPPERLALSPQCGFASTMEGNWITAEEQRAKLELVGSVARSVWGEG